MQQTADGFVTEIGGSIHTPAYHHGKVFVGAYGTHDFYALDAATGRSEFGLRLSDDGATAPACQDGVCVFNTYSCTVFAVDADTGKHLWSWWLGSPQLATTVIAGDLVLSSYPGEHPEKGRTYVIGAFDLHTGEPAWLRWIDGEVNSTPVATDGHIYLATVQGKLYDFSRDGDILSVQDNGAASPPVAAESSLFYARQKLEGHREMLVTMEEILPKLEHDRRMVQIQPKPRPLVADNRLIQVVDGTLVATDRKNGKALWTHVLADDSVAEISAPLLYAGKSVLLATASGSVVRMDPDSGEVTDTFALGQGQFASPPIVVNGWIYAGTTSGLVGFNTGDRELTGWSMLGGAPDRRGGITGQES